MKSGKKSKRIIIIISIAVLLIGAAVCFCISGFPRPSLKKISTSVDNSYRNDVRNEYNANAVGGDDKLFFEAYNHFLFSGIYQIDSGITRRVYTAELSITPYVPFSPYVYRGRMLDVDNGAICSLNYLNGKFEPFLDPPMKDGEKPVKAGGKIFIIDGGISKAYHKTTGIAGYTAIFTSKHLYLAEHQPYEPLKEDGTQVFHRPIMHLVHTMPERLRIRDTDNGTELKEQIRNLEALHEAFRSGRIREIFE